MSSVAVQRLKHLLPAIVALFLGIVFLVFSFQSSSFECTRATGMCVVSRTSFGTTTTKEFAMSAVREVRLIDKIGKHGDKAEIALVYSNGAESRFGRGSKDDVVEEHHFVQTFFSPAGTAPSWGYGAKSPVLPRVLGIGGILLGIGLGVHGLRKRVIETVPLPKGTNKIERTVAEERERRGRKAKILKIAALVGGLTAVMLVLTYITHHGKGTLALRCEQRCRFENAECLPGGKVDYPLDPGDYTVEVWASSGNALWIPKTVTIEKDVTTTFVCR